MRTETSAADLVEVVCAVPGVRGIEAGIASTLRTLDARLRSDRASHTRYGLVIDSRAGTVTAEVGLGPGAPVRTVVEEIQRAVQRALDRSAAGPVDALPGAADALPGAADALPGAADALPVSGAVDALPGPADGRREGRSWQVLVRVQSVSPSA